MTTPELDAAHPDMRLKPGTAGDALSTTRVKTWVGLQLSLVRSRWDMPGVRPVSQVRLLPEMIDSAEHVRWGPRPAYAVGMGSARVPAWSSGCGPVQRGLGNELHRGESKGCFRIEVSQKVVVEDHLATF
ncbi:hypothetical protein [Nocardia sp. NPDC057030]|uniref:hypothetical protein n=1 Tax=unclassified Nocardia TaxID=2637762 RepID=UPI00363C0B40